MEKLNKTWFLRVTTLTPVHIGTGETLNAGLDYVFPDARGQHLGVVNPEQILGLFPPERLANAANTIEKGEDIFRKLRQYRRDVHLESVSKRLMRFNTKDKQLQRTSEIREQQCYLDGSPLIPTSSFKGAIRCNWAAARIAENPAILSKESNFKKWGRYSDTPLRKVNEAPSPNQDPFRFWKVCDLEFGQTQCMRVDLLNLKGDNWCWDNRRSHYIEGIPVGEQALVKLKVSEKLAKMAVQKTATKRERIEVGDEFFHPEQLLGIAHSNTLSLLRKEIEVWQEESDSILDEFYRRLNILLEEAEAFGPNEFLIRVGYGSGWDSVTGGWQRDYLHPKELKNVLWGVAKKRHQDLTPKTRRLIDKKTPMGFVKVELGSTPFEKILRKEIQAPIMEDEKIPEPIKPETRCHFEGKVKDGAKIPANFLRDDPERENWKFFELLLPNGMKQEISLKYSAEIKNERGPILKITKMNKQSGEVITVGFAGYKQ